MKFNKDRFVFHELFTNENGKNSGSGFIGVVLGLITGVGFILTFIGYFFKIPLTIEVMSNLLLLGGISAGLLGVRKVWGTKEDPKTDEKDTDLSV